MKITKPCEQCGSTFTAAHQAGRSEPKFCTRTCLIADRDARSYVDVTCVGCAVTFTAMRSRDRKFCDACVASGDGKPGAPPRARVPVTCDRCGKDFEKYLSQMNTKRHFCSADCMNQAGGRPRTQRTCEHCSATFVTKQGTGQSKHLRTSRSKRFCSRICYDLHQAANHERRTCERCSEAFAVPPSSKKRFCSHSCANQARIDHGGRRITSAGYVQVYRPDSSEADANGWGAEHRILMADLLGRPLRRGENVHHIDTDPTNNEVGDAVQFNPRGNWSSGNLELWTTAQPSGRRAADAVRHAREVLALYGVDPAVDTGRDVD